MADPKKAPERRVDNFTLTEVHMSIHYGRLIELDSKASLHLKTHILTKQRNSSGLKKNGTQSFQSKKEASESISIESQSERSKNYSSMTQQVNHGNFSEFIVTHYNSDSATGNFKSQLLILITEINNFFKIYFK